MKYSFLDIGGSRETSDRTVIMEILTFLLAKGRREGPPYKAACQSWARMKVSQYNTNAIIAHGV